MSNNTIDFVREVISTLRDEGIDAWLGGGWAEELRSMDGSRPHSDVDLYLRSHSFGPLEQLVDSRVLWEEIPGKRFSHKRAFETLGVIVELILVDPEALETSFFDGRAVVSWPEDMFDQADIGIPCVSGSALRVARQKHEEVERAYRGYLESQAPLNSRLDPTLADARAGQPPSRYTY